MGKSQKQPPLTYSWSKIALNILTVMGVLVVSVLAYIQFAPLPPQKDIVELLPKNIDPATVVTPNDTMNAYVPTVLPSGTHLDNSTIRAAHEHFNADIKDGDGKVLATINQQPAEDWLDTKEQNCTHGDFAACRQIGTDNTGRAIYKRTDNNYLYVDSDDFPISWSFVVDDRLIYLEAKQDSLYTDASAIETLSTLKKTEVTYPVKQYRAKHSVTQKPTLFGAQTTLDVTVSYGDNKPDSHRLVAIKLTASKYCKGGCPHVFSATFYRVTDANGRATVTLMLPWLPSGQSYDYSAEHIQANPGDSIETRTTLSPSTVYMPSISYYLIILLWVIVLIGAVLVSRSNMFSKRRRHVAKVLAWVMAVMTIVAVIWMIYLAIFISSIFSNIR